MALRVVGVFGVASGGCGALRVHFGTPKVTLRTGSTSTPSCPGPPATRGWVGGQTLPAKEWNGRNPKLIVDAEGRIITILLGKPDDPDWDYVVKEAMKELARARRRARCHGVWSPASHIEGVTIWPLLLVFLSVVARSARQPA
ncbi:hypothetical protein B0H10DRAFT_2226889 [Mycena sp. CBHHK59/15]|nr:hypothetical protein B0H10DRAFT_2226889 [Mycena sp. CBHHK59/15]